MNKINNTNTLEKILKEFSAQRQLVDGLGDALMHVTLAGSFNEDNEWQEPEWKNDVLRNLAQARELIMKLYNMGLDHCKVQDIKFSHQAAKIINNI